MKKSTTRITIVVVILIVAVVGYFCYLMNRSRQLKNADAEISTVEMVLSRSMELDYPATVKEVIKYYNELMKCFYNEDCTEEEIEQLGYRARQLYDKELLENNELDSYLAQLKWEINDYRSNKRKITSFSISSATNVDYYDRDGYSFAKIQCSYNVMEGTISKPVSEVYLLRRDKEDSRWKIYGWELTENLQNSESSENNEG